MGKKAKQIEQDLKDAVNQDRESAAANNHEVSDTTSQKSKSTEATNKALKKATKQSLNFTLREPTE